MTVPRPVTSADLATWHMHNWRLPFVVGEWEPRGYLMVYRQFWVSPAWN